MKRNGTDKITIYLLKLYKKKTKPQETYRERGEVGGGTLESGLRENSGMERNSSSEMKPLALRSSWQKRSYSDTISCCETAPESN